MEEEIECDLQSKIHTQNQSITSNTRIPTTNILPLTELIHVQYTPCICNEPTAVWLVICSSACSHGSYIPTSVGQGVSLQSKFDETKEL